jgi:DNA-binding transcriptional ArsR family regulator
MKKPTADVFAAIGDPTRRQILSLLTAGALSIQGLAGNFDVSRPAVSKHIKLLEEAGLISVEDRGRERWCTLDPTGFNEIRDWLKFYDRFWTSKLKRLGKLLKKQTTHKKKKP